ncbi:amino acid ABC transporter permease [Lyngbya confervoides]|uniref:amino acid ABC transporter permease n=1 Tax=Lyngbya confervoides TaxID=207921 RepID=UPI001F260D16
MRRNLFSSVGNTLLTILCLVTLAAIGQGLWHWLTEVANWQVVQVNLPLLLVGRFPRDQLWRIWVILGLILGIGHFSWGYLDAKFTRAIALWGGVGAMAVLVALTLAGRPLGWILALWLGSGICWGGGHWLGSRFRQIGQYFPVLWAGGFFGVLWLLGGGLGLQAVSRTLWQGLVLTLLMAFSGIILSFPMGVLLALGRRSSLPVIRLLSIFYIEVVRGLPLIGILFSAQVLLPLIFPRTFEIDNVTRAIAGLTLFSAAYLAENVRGGLQSVPSGQVDAAEALGLTRWTTLGLIVLPQALRAVIPAIVGQFIGLLKDTTLLSLVGLFELLGMARSVLSQPEFIGYYGEVYSFVGVLYWIFCYLMSLGSRQLEIQRR